MNDSRGSSTTGLVLAFLAGVVSGAVVALLTAPRSGRETRDRIKDPAVWELAAKVRLSLDDDLVVLWRLRHVRSSLPAGRSPRTSASEGDHVNSTASPRV